MDFFNLLGAVGWIMIIVAIIIITIFVKLIIAVFRIRDNTERAALILEAMAESQNIKLPTEYTENFNKNHYQ